MTCYYKLKINIILVPVQAVLHHNPLDVRIQLVYHEHQSKDIIDHIWYCIEDVRVLLLVLDSMLSLYLSMN